jgi:protein CWC15
VRAKRSSTSTSTTTTRETDPIEPRASRTLADDDTAALLAELERIKAERAEQTQKKAAAEAAAELEEKRSELAAGNPLLDLGGGGRGGGDFRTKRRWDDDVVFRNQARDEPKVGKRFINDTIRSDFHKRFLNKYIK